MASKQPDGWRRVSDDVWGVSILMPPSAAIEATAKSRTWKAAHEGATYEVVEMARPKSLESQDLIKLVLAQVGVSCQKDMRISGRVDTDTLTFTRFETTCSGGGRRYGKLWIDTKRVLALVVRDEQNSENRDAFLDSVK